MLKIFVANFEVLIQAFVQKDCGKPQSITIRIASFHTELQITKQDS
jgi:hypothetical protein